MEGSAVNDLCLKVEAFRWTTTCRVQVDKIREIGLLVQVRLCVPWRPLCRFTQGRCCPRPPNNLAGRHTLANAPHLHTLGRPDCSGKQQAAEPFEVQLYTKGEREYIGDTHDGLRAIHLPPEGSSIPHNQMTRKEAIDKLSEAWLTASAEWAVTAQQQQDDGLAWEEISLVLGFDAVESSDNPARCPPLGA